MNKNKPEKNLHGLPVAPSMQPALTQLASDIAKKKQPYHLSKMTLYSFVLGITGGAIAWFLTKLIYIITNVAFYGQLSADPAVPEGHQLGWFVVFVPVIGGIIVGFMARYGSQGIRGHGIPEAMEHVLHNQSRIPPRLTFLKPVSSAIAIGTGGPFGAEGPIIATGGALGSLLGQLRKTTADERKILLAAGAAAGMSATFGSPVSAVLLVMELLLFELRAFSIIPVAIASVTAVAVRFLLVGNAPVFPMTDLQPASSTALFIYTLVGCFIGIISVGITKAVYWIEELFEKLPIHWMWWPAIGGIAVGFIGHFFPETMGVGYYNIEQLLNNELVLSSIVVLFIFKFLSWVIALGSGTSGGTLAPLFIIGGGLGALTGNILSSIFPQLGIDPRVMALVGMAALFAGASRAFLASVVFAFEVTMQPNGLFPLLGGCAGAYLLSTILMEHSIMTTKIVRRGKLVPMQYMADVLEKSLVREFMTRNVVTIQGDKKIQDVRDWMSSGQQGSTHQGFPVVDESGSYLGMIRRSKIFSPDNNNGMRVSDLIHAPVIFIFEENSLSKAADLMAEAGVGRLAVVDRMNHKRLIGIISRSDILKARQIAREDSYKKDRSIDLRARKKGVE